jgi:hypothetical protein
METMASGSWIPSALPLPADAATVLTYACPQSGQCGLVTHQDVPGGSRATGASSAGLSTVALACPNANFCVATSRYLDSSGNIHGAIDTLSNGLWTPTEISLPADSPFTSIGFDGVACSAPASCAVIGGYTSPSLGSQESFIEMLSKGTWRQVQVPLPAGSGSAAQLHAISCFAKSSCIAIGSFIDSSSNGQGLIETLAKRQWTATTAPLPANSQPSRNTQLDAIACPANGSCYAVGYYAPSSSSIQSPNYGGLIATLSGGSWTATESPPPTQLDFFFFGLNAISCASRTFCVALGDGLYETLANGKWTGTNPPMAPGATFEYFGAVSCPALGSCATIGQGQGSTSNTQGVIGVLSRGSWTATAAPVPANGGNAYSSLSDVSCVTVRFCVLLGGTGTTSYASQSYVDLLAPGSHL